MQQLSSGFSMPLVGIGTWKVPSDQIEPMLDAALGAGYRHLDLAFLYGNQEAVGACLGRLLDKHGLARQDLFITSKIWCTDHGARVPAAAKEILQQLQLEYLDLLLIHWPVPMVPELREIGMSNARGADFYLKPEYRADIPLADTWLQLVELQKAGLTRSIGVSNFTRSQLAALPAPTPAVNQVEMHLWLPQPELVAYCKQHNIQVTAYSPLAMGAQKKEVLLREPALLAMAKAKGCTPAQLALRGLSARGIVVIPKSTNADRIKENIEHLKVQLSPADLDELAVLGNKRKRLILGWVKDQFVETS